MPALEAHLACESRILLGLSGDRARFAAEDPSPATRKQTSPSRRNASQCPGFVYGLAFPRIAFQERVAMHVFRQANNF